VHILGATGYTGQELFDLLKNHPMADIVSITSETSIGKELCEVTAIRSNKKLVGLADAVRDARPQDVAFLCLPHGASRQAALDLVNLGVQVIDLGSDFRSDPLLVGSTANGSASPKLRIQYGLCELEAVGSYPSLETEPQIVANPGCYPTSVLLPLVPLLREDLVETTPIIVDAKSGTSGAGRQPRTDLLLAELAGNFSAYAPGRSHRHVSEIDGYLHHYSGAHTKVVFTPHLLPIARGILSTTYARLKRPSSNTSKDRIIDCWRSAYHDRPFVWIFEDGLPQLSHVTGTNRIAMGCTLTEDTLIIVSTIDNLLKGAAGQAVQNFNRLLGGSETMGLDHLH
jgi:N-acetyl-gamma-glutamyl-phosphate reductase